MPQATFDCVIRGGHVGTAVDEFDADIGIKDGVIAAIGRNLGPGATEIDAKSKLVLPGGIDAHAHIEQLSAAGIVNADTFESATTSAAFGGTRSIEYRPHSCATSSRSVFNAPVGSWAARYSPEPSP